MFKLREKIFLCVCVLCCDQDPPYSGRLVRSCCVLFCIVLVFDDTGKRDVFQYSGEVRICCVCLLITSHFCVQYRLIL
jgi:hypothetical protein